MHPYRTTRRSFMGLGFAGAARLLSPAEPVAAARAFPGRQANGLSGRVIWPQDPEYEEARWDFNARFSRFPAAIVRCERTEDVQNAVRWAREQDIPLRARSGGHSYEAFSVVDDGLVIDVGGLNHVAVDVSRGEAVVGAGVKLLDLYHRLWDDGVTIPAGTCPLVGIAGLTLGGGVGFLSRQYGLTCDNLLAVEMVDAAGDALRASEDEHADLFWALRGGGGGNFGIATAFTFRVTPVAEVAIYSVRWPWDDVAQVLDAWQRWAPFVDERLSAGFAVFDPSVGHVSLVAQFTGSDAEMQPLMEPMLRTGAPLSQEVKTVPYIAACEQFAGQPVAHSTFKNTSAFVSAPWSAAAIATFVDQMRASPRAGNVVGFFPGGGAVAAVEPGATAYVHRNALFDVQYQAYWQDAADEEAEVAWIRAMREAMLPDTTGAYVNYIDADLADWPTAYYGENLPRLMQVNVTYDPENFFSGPQTIPLA